MCLQATTVGVHDNVFFFPLPIYVTSFWFQWGWLVTRVTTTTLCRWTDDARTTETTITLTTLPMFWYVLSLCRTVGTKLVV